MNGNVRLKASCEAEVVEMRGLTAAEVIKTLRWLGHGVDQIRSEFSSPWMLLDCLVPHACAPLQERLAQCFWTDRWRGLAPGRITDPLGTSVPGCWTVESNCCGQTGSGKTSVLCCSLKTSSVNRRFCLSVFWSCHKILDQSFFCLFILFFVCFVCLGLCRNI